MRHRHSGLAVMPGRTDRKESGSSGADIQLCPTATGRTQTLRAQKNTGTIGSNGTTCFPKPTFLMDVLCTWERVDRSPFPRVPSRRAYVLTVT